MWHCYEHGDEFETQPEYIQHLEDSHPNSTPEHFSAALVAAVVGPSKRIHRDCPFCPSGFSDIAQMQSHLIFHLERLAQLALHNGSKASDDDSESEHSSQSHQSQLQGRKNSIFRDFDTEEDEWSFAELVAGDGTATVNKPSDIILNETTLGAISGALFVPNVNEWLQKLVTEESSEETNTTHENILSSLSPPKNNLKRFPPTEKYTIGWICSNSKTLSLAVAMLDELYAYPKTLPKASYIYTKGSIGHHNIVISCPGIQNSTYGTTKRLKPDDLRKAFPSIEYCFIIGIGSGISPIIQLGDVVISKPPQHWQRVSSVAYTNSQPLTWEHFPTPLLSALTKLESAEKHFYSGIIPRYIEEAKETVPYFRSLRLNPNQMQDLLFKASYKHVDRLGATRSSASMEDGLGEALTPCYHCDVSQTIVRPPRDIEVHFGKTISANQVLESTTIRNELGTRYESDMLCIEKGAYFLTSVPYLLINGICDYADSHRNKTWQDYATAVAVACAKGIVEYIPK